MIGCAQKIEKIIQASEFAKKKKKPGLKLSKSVNRRYGLMETCSTI